MPLDKKCGTPRPIFSLHIHSVFYQYSKDYYCVISQRTITHLMLQLSCLKKKTCKT